MVDIKGYEGMYAVTSCGKVWSYKTKKFLKSNINAKGYKRVCLCKNNGVKRLTIHKLVAMAYIPNLNDLPQINHKDENKDNNAVNNLEWCTNKYNSNYGTRNERMASKKMKRVLCVELNKVFKSITEASLDLGVNLSGISECCSGKGNTAGGYHWKYAEGTE